MYRRVGSLNRQISLSIDCSRLSWIRSSHHHHHQQQQPSRVDKLLVANRGEIACRLMRTARRLGVRTVAIFSEADRHALHVSMADEAVCVGGAAVTDSYLRADRVLRAASVSGASAVHPGYGFLSENAQFAEQCAAAGLTFVGPPPSAIRDMGVKSTSKQIMSAAGVPVISGYHGNEQSDARLLQEADNIGFPVMIKAVMGGGGKGMRVALTRDDFIPQLHSARREARKAFGDEVMLVEQFIERPRHVEVQIFADQRGNCVYLWERDCSVQRRHQKIIEEAPAPGVAEDVRRRLGESAVRAARAVNYVGAGTVEFIMDRQQRFFFMEMNTRLQVEHPVTEMVTGVDLVEWQLRVARGELLPIVDQQLVPLVGHSVEARIYAEQPAAGFIPAAGQLRYLNTPTPAADVRVETGVCCGDEVSVHYDPMIAKLAVCAADRHTALDKLRHCLTQYTIAGVDTNIAFLIDLVSHAEFVAANVDTEFIERHHQQLFPAHCVTHTLLCQAVMAVALARVKESRLKSANSSPFSSLTSTRFNYNLCRQMSLLSSDNVVHTVAVECGNSGGSGNSGGNDQYSITVGSNTYQVSASLDCGGGDSGGGSSDSGGGVVRLVCDIDGHVTHTQVAVDGDTVHLFTERGIRTLRLPEPEYVAATDGASEAVSDGVSAPMPGVIERLLVRPGERVMLGQPLIVVIAMKMEYVIKAPSNGVVEQFLFKAGDNVAKNTPLAKFTTLPPEGAE